MEAPALRASDNVYKVKYKPRGAVIGEPPPGMKARLL